MRGDLVSRPVDEVLREAEKLARGGVRELLVVSQDTSAYGVDMKYAEREWRGKSYQTRMKGLCEGLSELGLWTRLHYVYPYPHVDDIIPLMAEGKLLPYLDIPFQHASPRILKLMKRPGAVDKTLERIQRWRAICPDITIRSTFIVGFPGETEEDFEQLLAFLDQAELDRVGAFAYSPVDGASANALPGQVPEEVKQERLARFMALQAEISADKLERKVGTVTRRSIDRRDVDGDARPSPADSEGRRARDSTAWSRSEDRCRRRAQAGRLLRSPHHGQRRARPVRPGRRRRGLTRPIHPTGVARSRPTAPGSGQGPREA